LPGLGHYALEEAIDEYASRRRLAQDLIGGPSPADDLPDLETMWRRSWLPIFDSGGAHSLVLECEPLDSPSRVRQIDWGLRPEPDYAAVLAPSLGTYIQRWIAAIEAGRHHYDVERSRWVSTGGSPVDP
jgi:hypothetical protein